MPANNEKSLGRILCVTSNFPRWEGDSTTPFVLHLCQDLQALGWQVDVLAPHAPGCAARETLNGVLVERFRYLWPESLETVCYQGGALVNLRQNRSNLAKLPPLIFSEWAAVFRRLKSGRYDLLHSHWILPQGFTGALAAKPLRIPHVITVHGGDAFSLRGNVLAQFKRFALNKADAVTVNSSATRKAVFETAPNLKALHTIPMGVTEKFSDPVLIARIRKKHRKGNGPLLIFVGRIVYEKGIDDLIKAATILKDRLPDLTALIVGEGPDRQNLKDEVDRLGRADRIIFKGWVQPEQVPSYMMAGDIFVGPSKKSPDGWVEAQGLTFVEAMLAGTPVVATRSGGIVDAVKDGHTGLLVPENAPVELADAIERLAADPALCERLTAAGVKLAKERFTRSASAQRFSELFEYLYPTGEFPATDKKIGHEQ